MRVFPKVPEGIAPELAVHLRDLSACVQMELRARTRDDVGHRSIILLSPDGSSWEVTVDDTGTLITTKVQG